MMMQKSLAGGLREGCVVLLSCVGKDDITLSPVGQSDNNHFWAPGTLSVWKLATVSAVMQWGESLLDGN